MGPERAVSLMKVGCNDMGETSCLCFVFCLANAVKLQSVARLSTKMLLSVFVSKCTSNEAGDNKHYFLLQGEH